MGRQHKYVAGDYVSFSPYDMVGAVALRGKLLRKVDRTVTLWWIRWDDGTIAKVDEREIQKGLYS